MHSRPRGSPSTFARWRSSCWRPSKLPGRAGPEYSAELGFDLVIGGTALAKGSYRFGLNLDGEDAFSLILTSGEQRLVVPLDVAKSDAAAYVSFTIVPTDAPDAFVLEGRGGEFVGRVKLTVPYLAEHPEGEATH